LSRTFEKKITIEEQKQLSADDQKDYIKWLFADQGIDDEEIKALNESDFLLPTGGGADPSDSPGALPEKEAAPLANTQAEEDNSDLPSSMRGELSSLEEPVVAPATDTGEEPPAEEPVKAAEKPEGEPEAEPEGKPESEDYLKVNEQTAYKTKEDAIKGIDEKDRTINLRDEELRLARQESDLLRGEAESLRVRVEADTRAAELAAPSETTEPAKAPTPELPPMPTAQELYDVYDDPEKGPLEAMKLMMPHIIQDIQPIIDFAQRLQTMKADKFLEQLMIMQTPEIIQSFHEDYIYGEIDGEFPDFEGKWRDPDDPVGKEYARVFHSIDKSYEASVGASLSEISERSPQSVQWVIREVLSRMDAPSVNGDNPQEPATTEQPAEPTEPTHTDEADTKGEPNRRFTREEAQTLARETADIAVKAVHEQNRIHGQVQTEPAGVKTTRPAETRTVWTKEMIRKDPTGWAKSRRHDPNFQDATLDKLPQVRN